MKKLFVAFIILMVCLALYSSAFAAGNPVIYKTDNGIKIVATDAYFSHSEIFDDHQLVFDVVIYNDTKDDYTIICDNGYINGWEVEGHGYFDITAGMKKKETVKFDLEDVDMLTADKLQGIKEFKVKFHCFPGTDFLKNQKSTKKVNADWIKEKVKNHK